MKTRGYVRKRRYRKRYPLSKTQAKVVKKIATRACKRQQETKVHYTHRDESNESTLSQGTFFDPMDIDQGTAGDERLGNTIRAKNLHIQGVLHNTGSVCNFVRIVVFWAKDRQNFTNASGEFFVDNNGDPQTISSVTGLNAMYYPTNRALVTPLTDRRYRLGTGSATSDETRFFKINVPLKNKLIRYEEGTSGGADNVSPRLHVLFLAAEGEDDTSTGENIEVSCMMRFFYYDA